MTTTTETYRAAYRVLLQASGMKADAFKAECAAIAHEIRDGEGEGPLTPSEYVAAARQVALVAILEAAPASKGRAVVEAAWKRVAAVGDEVNAMLGTVAS